MAYYYICISGEASNLCVIILPCGKYRYKCLNMGVRNSLVISQEKMNEMFHGFEIPNMH